MSNNHPLRPETLAAFRGHVARALGVSEDCVKTNYSVDSWDNEAVASLRVVSPDLPEVSATLIEFGQTVVRLYRNHRSARLLINPPYDEKMAQHIAYFVRHEDRFLDNSLTFEAE